MSSTERVHFRLLQMPCCNFLACWLNPRLPNYCPECGKRVFPTVRSCVLEDDDKATLKHSGKITWDDLTPDDASGAMSHVLRAACRQYRDGDAGLKAAIERIGPLCGYQVVWVGGIEDREEDGMIVPYTVLRPELH